MTKYHKDLFNGETVSINRNAVKNWFLTFPRTDITRTDFLDHININLDTTFIAICQEEHDEDKDNQTEFTTNKHLHALFMFKGQGKKQSWILKHFKKLYPTDYKRIWFKPARNPQNVYNYMKKEDNDILEVGTFYRESKLSKENQKFLDEINEHSKYCIPDEDILELVYKYELYECQKRYITLCDRLTSDSATIITTIHRQLKYSSFNKLEKLKFYRIRDEFYQFLDTLPKPIRLT